MTNRQLVFCKNYLAGASKEQAALEAGYSQKNATAAANRLLREPQIKQYLEEQRPQFTKSIAGSEEILQYLTNILRSNNKEVTVRDKMKAAELLGKNRSLFSEGGGLDKACVVFQGENEIAD